MDCQPAPKSRRRDLLLVMNALPFLTLLSLALITEVNLFLFTYLCLRPFYLSFILYVLLYVWLTDSCLAGWPRASPSLSPLSLALFSLKPRFLLLLFLSAGQPCLSVYCLAAGRPFSFLLDQSGALGRQNSTYLHR